MTTTRISFFTLIAKCFPVMLILHFGSLQAQRSEKFNFFVDPLIGTGGHGHTYPGVSLPFGMIQVSPDTRIEGWDGCSGYHASDSMIYGFSHTHLSGTGCSDYGDILLMPVCGTISLEQQDFSSPFQPSSEYATPGYYRVELEKYSVGVELTATRRAGFHCYRYHGRSQPAIILDLVHRDNLLDAEIRITGDCEVEGFRFSSAWAKEQRLYFVIRFSRAFSAYSIDTVCRATSQFLSSGGSYPRAIFSFPPMENGGDIFVKIGISAVSIEGARKNLETEIPGWHFDQVVDEAQKSWNNALKKILIKDGDSKRMAIFYTALYHAMLSPDLYMDVDGEYLGRDLQPHKADSFDYYTVFSLWDTYRALHPLLTILDQKRTNDFIQTFIHQYEEGSLLPVWELSANETNCMIGYHAVPVIADAYLKGIRNYDVEKALEAMKFSATQDHFGLKWYRELGFIPWDKEGESVSRTLEYAFDDWCIAQMAKALGKDNDYQEYMQRAQSYQNLWDPSTRFFRAKSNNQWVTPFDPFEVNFHYTEANAWQYSLYVPQDIPGLIRLMGGVESFEHRLDTLFSTQTETTGRDQADITGLIGQYAHGNEPSHHMAYLYDYCGQPWKTQELVHRITTTLYSTSRDGLAGNEDCGQMSAWYVFSALGFYPVTPAGGLYAIGTPLFPYATIRLENGNHFTIRAHNLSDNNYYIQSCVLNGQPYDVPFIRHETLMEGGELLFEMGSIPNKSWGVFTEDQALGVFLVEPVPFFASGESTFLDSTLVALASIDQEATIYYRIMDTTSSTLEKIEAGREGGFNLYSTPIILHQNTVIQAYAQKIDGKPSRTIESVFTKIPQKRTIHLNTPFASQYAAGGNIALIDGKKGKENFKTGIWQGYEGVNLDAVVDLGDVQQIHKVSVGFLQDVDAWIFFPTQVEFFTSVDGLTYPFAGVSIHEISQKDLTPRTLQQWQLFDPPVEARYIRVIAKNPGICPEWHPGSGKPCWIFTDEITVE